MYITVVRIHGQRCELQSRHFQSVNFRRKLLETGKTATTSRTTVALSVASASTLQPGTKPSLQASLLLLISQIIQFTFLLSARKDNVFTGGLFTIGLMATRSLLILVTARLVRILLECFLVGSFLIVTYGTLIVIVVVIACGVLSLLVIITVVRIDFLRYNYS